MLIVQLLFFIFNSLGTCGVTGRTLNPENSINFETLVKQIPTSHKFETQFQFHITLDPGLIFSETNKLFVYEYQSDELILVNTFDVDLSKTEKIVPLKSLNNYFVLYNDDCYFDIFRLRKGVFEPLIREIHDCLISPTILDIDFDGFEDVLYYRNNELFVWLHKNYHRDDYYSHNSSSKKNLEEMKILLTVPESDAFNKALELKNKLVNEPIITSAKNTTDQDNRVKDTNNKNMFSFAASAVYSKIKTFTEKFSFLNLSQQDDTDKKNTLHDEDQKIFTDEARKLNEWSFVVDYNNDCLLDLILVTPMPDTNKLRVEFWETVYENNIFSRKLDIENFFYISNNIVEILVNDFSQSGVPHILFITSSSIMRLEPSNAPINEMCKKVNVKYDPKNIHIVSNANFPIKDFSTYKFALLDVNNDGVVDIVAAQTLEGNQGVVVDMFITEKAEPNNNTGAYQKKFMQSLKNYTIGWFTQILRTSPVIARSEVSNSVSFNYQQAKVFDQCINLISIVRESSNEYFLFCSTLIGYSMIPFININGFYIKILTRIQYKSGNPQNGFSLDLANDARSNNTTNISLHSILPVNVCVKIPNYLSRGITPIVTHCSPNNYSLKVFSPLVINIGENSNFISRLYHIINPILVEQFVKSQNLNSELGKTSKNFISKVLQPNKRTIKKLSYITVWKNIIPNSELLFYGNLNTHYWKISLILKPGQSVLNVVIAMLLCLFLTVLWIFYLDRRQYTKSLFY